MLECFQLAPSPFSLSLLFGSVLPAVGTMSLRCFQLLLSSAVMSPFLGWVEPPHILSLGRHGTGLLALLLETNDHIPLYTLGNTWLFCCYWFQCVPVPLVCL